MTQSDVQALKGAFEKGSGIGLPFPGARGKSATGSTRPEWHSAVVATTSAVLWIILLESGLAHSLKLEGVLWAAGAWLVFAAADASAAFRTRLPLERIWFLPEALFALLFASPASVFFLLLCAALRSLVRTSGKVDAGPGSRSQLLHHLGVQAQRNVQDGGQRLPHRGTSLILVAAAALGLGLQDAMPEQGLHLARALLLVFCVLWARLLVDDLRGNA